MVVAESVALLLLYSVPVAAEVQPEWEAQDRL